MMTVGSLFSGIGGFDLAAERVFGPGSVRWQVEIDPWCRRVLAKHWPDVPKFSDIREVTGDSLEPVDIVCGGFPCQPFSGAGQQLGEADPRHLWPEMCRLVRSVRPCWVVGENVPPLVRLGLDAVSADLENLGYTVGTVGIPACAVGALHIRERLWIVAHAESERWRTRRTRRLAGGGEGTSEPALRTAVADAGGIAGVRSRLQLGNRKAEGGGRGSSQRCEDRQLAEVGASTASGIRPGWDAEPGMGRVAYGLPDGMDRLRGLGNAVVPQIPERLFRWIAAAQPLA